ncbi:MAG: restriction endonuclease [Spirochaetia bacterium]|nr:MAG: restriction endonuclease [Spirochaetia bacterium]
MARRRRYTTRDDELESALAGILTLALIALIWYFFTNPGKSVAILVAVLAVIFLSLFLRRWWRKKHLNSLLNKLKSSGQEDVLKHFISISGSEKGKGEGIVEIRGYKFKWYEIDDLKNALKKAGITLKEKDVLSLLEFYIREKGEGFIRGLKNIHKEPQKFSVLMATEFEELLCCLFEAMGYATRHNGRPGDQGGDVIANKEGEKILIQAKRYSDDNPTGNGAVQEAFTAMKHYGCNKAIVITTSYFTPEAIAVAKTTQTRLVAKKELQELLLKYLGESWF